MPYDFDRLVERRGTSSLKWDFEERFTRHRDLLPLWVADMDFVAPNEITDAIRKRVEHGVFGYTLEPESYFDAAAAWLERRHGWRVKREWMLASPGVIPCLSAAILALTEPGDAIVVQPPVYYPFTMRIEGNARRVVENPLVLRGDRWEMDLEGLAKAADEAHARMLVLCSPHNPVCRVWDRPTLERLVEICAARNMVIVSDDIHCDLVMPGFRHIPITTVSPKAAEISIVLFAATKTFNLAGLGGSLAIVPNARLRERLDAKQRAIFAGVANAPAVAGCEAAWRHGEKWLEELIAYVQGNFTLLGGFLSKHLPSVKLFPLEGTYLAWLDMRALGIPDKEVDDKLRGVGKVWLDEGPMFGSGGEGYQRLNLACPRSILEEATKRMVRALG